MRNVDWSTIRDRIDNLLPELILLRRSLHQEPELGWVEYKTTEKIWSFLREKGLKKLVRPLKTGVVAEIVNDLKAPYIGIRADIDALPIRDEKTVEYHSRIEGISHACGHDIHTTILCGVAAIMRYYQNRIPFNLRFIFQPAEEPIPSGAPKLIENGVLDKIQTMWGMHVEPALQLGSIGLAKGWVNAQSIKLEWEIYGLSGHSARPHLARNPISAGIRLVEKIQKFFEERESDDRYPTVFAFTNFKSKGEAYNAIPDCASIGATLRLTNTAQKESFLLEIESINKSVETEFGVILKLNFIAGSPPVLNDALVIDKFYSNLQQLNLSDFQIVNHQRSMGGDDFGWYSQKVPSALIRFGVALNDQAPGVHTGLFDVPDGVIPLAILFFLSQIFLWDD
ncbi:MAG: amidohydrolase [Calditrichia bacterium]|nr:amidohydrolase [Calditrichia bacterium]